MLTPENLREAAASLLRLAARIEDGEALPERYDVELANVEFWLGWIAGFERSGDG